MASVEVRWPEGDAHTLAVGLPLEEAVRDRYGKKHGWVAARISGVAVDLKHPLNSDCNVEPIEAESEEGEHIIRHSCAHLLAQAVTELFPEAKPTIGPAIEHGFYYDFDMDPPSDEDLRAIGKRMQQIVRQNLAVERIELSDEELKDRFSHNPYKIEIIEDKLEDGDASTIYEQGGFHDLCLGPHVPRTSMLMHHELTTTSTAYWRADQSRTSLVRIYGIAFSTKERLAAHRKMLKEAKQRDHRRIGKDLQLFHISDKVGQGLILWTPRGAIVRQELQDFISQELRRQDYQQVFTPHIGKLDLYRMSGHFPYYQESQYPPLVERELLSQLADEGCTCGELANRMDEGDVEGYLLKPMNCPHHIQIYTSQARSYRDLPLRLAEFGTVYRWEQSGEISGMTRVRGFTQDDAHLFVTEDQIATELAGCIELVQIIFGTLGMDDYRVRVGIRDEDSTKYVGDHVAWDKAEESCRSAAKKLGVPFQEEKGEAAFYGPKIDFVVHDVLGREWQLGTVQVDYNLPERFDLTYVGSDGEKHRPIMIHRAPFGSMERFVGVLIEHFEGRFPTWLTPTQVHILTISESHRTWACEVFEALREKGVRVEIDDGDDTLGKKIRTHRAMRPAYMIIIGEAECENRTISLRDRQGEQVGEVNLETFIEMLRNEIDEKESTLNLVKELGIKE